MEQRKETMQQGPPDIDQLVSIYRLGPQIGEFPRDGIPEFVRLIITCVLLLLLLFFLFLPIQNTGSGPPWNVVVGIALLVPCGIYLILCISRLFSGRVYVFTDGFIYLKDRPYVFRWEEVENIREYQRRLSYILFASCTVERANGQSILINIREVGLFAALLRQKVSSARSNAIRQTYQQGQAVNFGLLSVSREGISYENKLLPWSEVSKVSVLWGKLHIQSVENNQTDWATIEEGHIPNLPLFMKVVQYRLSMKQRNISDAVAESMAAHLSGDVSPDFVKFLSDVSPYTRKDLPPELFKPPDPFR